MLKFEPNRNIPIISLNFVRYHWQTQCFSYNFYNSFQLLLAQCVKTWLCNTQYALNNGFNCKCAKFESGRGFKWGFRSISNEFSC